MNFFCIYIYKRVARKRFSTVIHFPQYHSIYMLCVLSYISKRMVTFNLRSLRLLLARVFLTCESFHENSSLNAPSECEENRSSKQRKYQITSSPQDEKHNCVLFWFQENLSTPEIHFWNLIITTKKTNL